MDDFEERVRRRAYQLWQDEGRPEGREQAHWERARELVELEDSLRDAPGSAAAPDMPGGPTAAAGPLGKLPLGSEPAQPGASAKRRKAAPKRSSRTNNPMDQAS